MVAMDRTMLIESLDADSRRRCSPARFLPSWFRIPAPVVPRRVGYAGAFAALATVLVAVVIVAAADRLVDRTVVETEFGGTPATSPQSPDPGLSGSLTSTSTTSTSTSSTSIAVAAPADPQPTPTVKDTLEDGDGSELDPTSNAPQTTAVPPTTTVQPTTAAPPTTAVPPTTSAAPAAAAGSTESVTPIAGPFNPVADLLVLHYDFAHLDDGHAAMTAREIVTWFDLDPLVVAGTQATESNSYVHPYEQMMNAAWTGVWLDAGATRAASIATAADRWLATLDAGGHVWVADGGVSDFTAEVAGEVQRRRPAVDLATRLHVVQHSQRNEDATRSDDLEFVRGNSEYVRIDDGNGPNGSADLNGPSGSFEAAASGGDTAPAWVVAFNYMSAGELDFSDTVELLHIVGLGTDDIANADDFAEYFMGG